VAWFVWRTGARLFGERGRVFVAGLAGYVSINVSALFAAVEMGLQPLWFHDAAGAPLYAPYSLRIAVPAMMIGHLTIAGVAEAVLTGGVVAWLLKAEPGLLGFAAVPERATRSLRPLWTAVALLMILTPLGILAAGAAWGEWAPEAFTRAEARQQMADASLSAAPPAAAPAGLERLASFWTAPIPHYAPAMLKSPQFGYVLSAMAGTGLIMLASFAVGWLLRRAP